MVKFLSVALGALLALAGPIRAAEFVLPNCDGELIYVSDGTQCVTVTIQNTSTAPASSQNYSIRYANGTVVNDTGNGPGQGAVANCFIQTITAHEVGAPTGKVTITLG